MDELNINLTDLKVSLTSEDVHQPEEGTTKDESTNFQIEPFDDQSLANKSPQHLDHPNSDEEDNYDELMGTTEDCLDSSDDEEESSDDEELLQVAFMIDSSQLSGENSTNTLPINGHDYLRQVQIEREKYPAVSYSKPPPPRIDKQCPPSPWVELLLSKSNRDRKATDLEQSS